MKQPNIYAKIWKSKFALRVCEADFREKLDDLIADSSLSLLHTRVIRIVCVVCITKSDTRKSLEIDFNKNVRQSTLHLGQTPTKEQVLI